MFKIEEVGYERIEELLSILIERAIWLENKNIKMWEVSKLTKEEIISRYRSPKVFLGIDSDVVGGFLLSEIDTNYWKEGIYDNAFYLHKFAVRKEFGGKGYSIKMLKWIKKYGREMGKDYIRLDFVKDRDYVRRMYHEQGFIEIEEMTSEIGLALVKAEYRIGREGESLVIE